MKGQACEQKLQTKMKSGTKGKLGKVTDQDLETKESAAAKEMKSVDR